MKKILVIRLSSLGDVVLTAPILRAMRLQAGVEVHLLTKPFMGDLLKGGDAVDRFYTWGEPNLFAKLKSEKYDGVLDLHCNFRSYRTLLNLYLCTTRVFRLDWPGQGYDKKRFQRWLFVKTKSPRFSVSHVQERYLQAANGLLQMLIQDENGSVVSGGLGGNQRTELVLSNYGGGLPSYPKQEGVENYGVAILGGTYATKRIPEKVWEMVFRCDERRWVLIGGKDDKAMAQRLAQQFGGQLVDQVGVFDLATSARCIAQAAIVVGGDTGFTHVAASYNKPTLVIWGNTHPGLGFAAGKNNENVLHLMPKSLSCHPCTKLGFDECPKAHFSCMNDYSMAEIKLLLQKLQAFSLEGS